MPQVNQLLATKLYPPPLRSELVSRHRLIEKLNQGLYRKLTLISAPAGFGKTTLIGEWLGAIQKEFKNENQPIYKTAWFSMDKDDNEETRFLNYFVTAIKRIDDPENVIGERAFRILQSTQLPQTNAVLTSLINEIAQIQHKIILIFDDYHMIDSQMIHDGVVFFIENMPPQIHLVISTREDPPLPIPRLRARDQLTELRAADLRFSLSESGEFLTRVMGLSLSEKDNAALENRTEGWIAGLQLAAISLQGHPDISRLIQSFTGSNRFVLDYLVDEVLNQQPERIQSFLLKTSILDRLCGSLCNELTGQNHSQGILEMLERANLFIIPLDGERQWYRYHHLFADLLRQRLRQTSPGQEPILNNRASAWYEQNNFLNEAIEHSLQAGEHKHSAAMIAGIADDLWKRGEHLKLRGWLEKLTEDWVCIQPKLCIYHAWFLFSTGLQEEADRYLQAAEQSLIEATQESEISSTHPEITPDLDRNLLEGRLNAIRALAKTWGEDFSTMIRYASSALSLLPIRDPWRSMAELVLGDAYYYKGEMQASYQTRLKTAAACQAEDDLFFYMIANLKVATSLREMGKLEQAISICKDQLEFARENGLTNTIFAGWAMGLLGIILADRNDLEQALKLTTRYVEIAKGNDLGFVGSSYMWLMKTQFYRGELDAAESTLNELAEIGQKHYLPHHISGPLKAWQARLALAQNRLEIYSQVVASSDLEENGVIPLIYDEVVLVHTRFLLLQGNYADASRILEPLIEATQNGGSTARLIELLVLQALANQGQGELELAIHHIEHALSLAEPGGFVRFFIDEGPPMARLLIEALSRGIAKNYVQSLLAAFPDIEAEQPKTGESPPGDEVWIEALSTRETDILKLIAEGLTNQEIASRLYLSLNTVKVHTRNIYGKLGVNSRTQAAAKARTFGILQ